MAEVEIEVTSNFEFLDNLEEGKDTAVLEGSTRSTKTYSIEQFLTLRWCMEQPGSTVRCFRHDSTTHNKTTIKDFKEIMVIMDLWDEGSWNGTEKEFKFDNGSLFAFAATSDHQKLHGLKQDVAWLNEVMEIDSDAYAQIAFRTTQLTIMDFNPSFNHHWVFSEIIPADNCAYKHSTYKDNPFLTDKQVHEIEKYEPTDENIRKGTADAWKWDVYGLGKRGKIEGSVFSLFEVTDFFPERSLCQRWGMGMDFGFSLDPTTLIECALFQDGLYLREWIYEKGLITTENVTRPGEPSIEGHLKEFGIGKDVKIYADCAAPQQIADLQISGFNVIPCVKGPGSVLQGIDLMKQRKIFIHRKSPNIQLEFEHYRWKKRASDGEFKREPEDKWNHAVDAARYWCMAELQQDKWVNAHGSKKVKVKSRIRTRSARR